MQAKYNIGKKAETTTEPEPVMLQRSEPEPETEETTEEVEGCMDPAAANYDEAANVNLDYTCAYAPVAVAGTTTTVDEGTTVQFNGAGSAILKRFENNELLL